MEIDQLNLTDDDWDNMPIKELSNRLMKLQKKELVRLVIEITKSYNHHVAWNY